ncbi:hypothetical protein TNCT_318481 [Trichonephila clavata]|uniref:Uncharacterized protein n=1 Tax=Trichonephila clavata TaxID=2740835 RepID=A0A8X6LGS8_TRICU|nr:hypothetical protein TNCT_318481 [Trichonephila clavata]
MPNFNAFYESFFSDRLEHHQEEEPMDWEDALPLSEVSIFLSRPPWKMSSLISPQVSAPPVSANRFPNMRALVPKARTAQAPKVSVMSLIFNVIFLLLLLTLLLSSFKVL